MTDGQKKALGAIVRWALLIICASLLKHHAIDDTILGVALNDATAQIVGWIGAGGVLVWSMINKWWDHKKLAVALVMPPASTEADLKAVVKNTSPGIVPTGPTPTPAQAAAIVNGGTGS